MKTLSRELRWLVPLIVVLIALGWIVNWLGYLPTAKSIVELITPLLLAIAAVVELRQWREQLIGTSQIEIARKIVQLAVQFRSEFTKARNPFSIPVENPETDDAEYRARIKMLQPASEVLNHLEEALWEAEAVLNQNLSETVKPFWKSYNKVYATVIGVHYPKSWNPSIPVEKQNEAITIIYGPDSERDALSSDVEQAVAKLKTELRQYLT